MVYTNLDINNMVDEIRVHLKGINNKKYIKECIDTNYKYGFITKIEKDILCKEFEV